MTFPPFAVIKIRTGETIFSEVSEYDGYKFNLINPLVVKTEKLEPGKDMIYLDRWVPFTDDEIFEIDADMCYYIGMLSDQYLKLYGSYLMREELQRIHKIGMARIANGEFKYSVVKDIAEEVKNLGEDYSIKFGISPAESMINDSDLSEDRILN